MRCPHCGKNLVDDPVVCVACGRPIRRVSRGSSGPEDLPRPGFGIPSVVCAIAGWGVAFWLWPLGAVGAVAAIGMGAAGLKRHGRGLAAAGIALGGSLLIELIRSLFGTGVFWISY